MGLKGSSYKTDFGPIEQGCDCYACRHFTRAYLRHLLRANEILGLRMLSVHSSHMYLKLMTDVRAAIAAGTFEEFYRAFIKGFTPSQKILAQRKKDIER
jgi:queuine tRNA-ribosyltransferase